MNRINIVCWMWKNPTIARVFLPEHVNVLYKMLKRKMSIPFTLTCISDDGDDLRTEIQWLKTPADCAVIGEIKSPEGARFPSCYRRLWSFSEDAATWLEKDCLFIDIDLIVMRDLKPLLDECDRVDFMGWRPLRDWGQKLRFGGGIYYLKMGTRTHVWTDFMSNPVGSIGAARNAGYRGSDQAWISYQLAGKEKCWSQYCGIYSVRDFKHTDKGPADAIIIQMNGPDKPWTSSEKFAKEHWK